MDYYIDAQDIQDLVLGVWSRVVLGIRKPAPDHRPSRLLVQEPLVLFILCIDVHKKISIPQRRPVPPTASAFAFRLGDSLSRGGE